MSSGQSGSFSDLKTDSGESYGAFQISDAGHRKDSNQNVELNQLDVDLSAKKAMDSVASYLEKFSPVTSASESTSLQSGSHYLFNEESPKGDDETSKNSVTVDSTGAIPAEKSEPVCQPDLQTSGTAAIANHTDLADSANQVGESAITSLLKNSAQASETGDDTATIKLNTKKSMESTVEETKPKKHYGKIGICAMDAKVLSKPCREILNRLIKFDEFDTVIFGEKSILDESIESWPICDYLISFFSNGFPLDKAIEYANLRKPFLINDLVMQKVLWDRRLCLRLLEAAEVATPERLEISRDGGPVNFIRDDLKQKLLSKGVNVDPIPEPEWKMLDDDTLWVDGKIMEKPFVEKPVDGEDHNVYIYYPSSTGGGGRRLFRKVGNKSSEFDAGLNMVRTNGSFIYEKFMDTENLEDVKAYTVGQYYCHAETRKSPVVDGIVRRNTRGKELRYVTTLTDQEREMANRVSKYFDQTICGFDILRAHNRSYVIDVNGFSFVKDNNEYYDNCAQILRNIFKKASSTYNITRSLQANGETDDVQEDTVSKILADSNSSGNSHVTGSAQFISKGIVSNKKLDDAFLKNKAGASTGVLNKPPHHKQYPSSSKWTFKGLVTVIRHADRTPKQKFKYSFRSPIFISLLKGHKEEVIIRQVSDLEIVLQTIKLAEEQKCEAPEKLRLLSSTLEKKINLPGTKIQLKPVLDKNNEVEKVQFILKWGGEPTHSARYQACDLGETTRQDIRLLNKEAFKNVKVYTSSERRVIASAKLWACSFLEKDELPDDFLRIRKDLLDDSNAAKDLMDKVKKKIKPLLRQGIKPPKQFAWPPKYPDPYYVTKRVVELMNYHQKVMDYNFRHSNIEELQQRWCCNEDPYLFRERWDKLFKEFVTFEKVDPSKISELYDTMKFDALHNREFLQHIFYPPDLDLITDEEELKQFTEDFTSPVLCDSYPINVLAMNNFQLPSDHSNVTSAGNSNTASRNNSSAKLAQQAQVIGKNGTANSAISAPGNNTVSASAPPATTGVTPGNPSSLEGANTTSSSASHKFLNINGNFSGASNRLSKSSISSASSSPGSSNIIHRVPSNDLENTTSAGSLGWILKSDYHLKNNRNSSPFDEIKFTRLRELYKLAKVLFDFVCPQEYGIENNEKLDIGLLTSLPLAKQVLSDITDMVETSNPETVAYFTKESHIYTLLNIIYESKLPMRIERNALPELDYLSQIVFELYESDDTSSGKKKHSIRLSLSPGCHTQDPLDVQLDAKHYISNIPKISLTRHLDTDLLIQKLKSRFSRVSLPKKFTPVNISSPLLIAAKPDVKDIPSIEHVGVSSSKPQDAGTHEKIVT